MRVLAFTDRVQGCDVAVRAMPPPRVAAWLLIKVTLVRFRLTGTVARMPPPAPLLPVPVAEPFWIVNPWSARVIAGVAEAGLTSKTRDAWLPSMTTGWPLVLAIVRLPPL